MHDEIAQAETAHDNALRRWREAEADYYGIRFDADTTFYRAQALREAQLNLRRAQERAQIER
jgi:hypothetical protein